MNKKNILNYIIIFLLTYIVLSFFFQGGEGEVSATGADFDISTNKEYGQSEVVSINIKNNTEFEALIKNECPNEPLNAFKKEKGEWTQITNSITKDCAEETDYIIKPHEEINIPYKEWNYSLFGDLGTYKVSASIEVAEDPTKNKDYESNEFEVGPQGWFGYLWTAGFYQPIYNALIFLISIIPGHDLGFGIILLTIIFRTILLIPSHKSMKSQRKIQELQPKLNKIKEKYKGNQERIAKETMMLWKDNKVNPLSSCLPLLIQFPILIGIFYVIQTGLNPDNGHLLYGSLQGFDIGSIQTNFLGILELTKVNVFVLPLIVGGLQFMQMKLAMMRKKKKGDDESKKKEKGGEMEMANQMMVYFMPVMIAVFTASMPAGVGLYWSVSTIFGTVQQLVVNKQVATETATVKVIKK